jgi:predicted DNA-binding transcriptional regulator AlpA
MADTHLKEVFLRTKQVRARYGNCSEMWITRRLAKDASFPRPVYLGRWRHWKLSELEKWEAAQAKHA